MIYLWRNLRRLRNCKRNCIQVIIEFLVFFFSVLFSFSLFFSSHYIFYLHHHFSTSYLSFFLDNVLLGFTTLSIVLLL